MLTFDWHSMNWYGIKLLRLPRFVLLQSHRRFNGKDCASQGVGLLQIARRHLFYLGSDNGRWRLCVGFVWVIGWAP